MIGHIKVTLILKLDRVDRVIFNEAISSSTEQGVRAYVLTTLLKNLSALRTTPLFGKANIESVELVQGKQEKRGK